MIVIETPRLILRTPRLSDAEEITAAKQAVWPELQNWMSWSFDGQETLEATREFINRASEKDQALIGLCRESSRYVVATGIHWRDQGPVTGYWVAKDFLGKGYATEATNAVIRYAFHAGGAEAVYIDYLQGNEKSRRVIEKLGFTPLEIRRGAATRCRDGQVMDEHWYVMRDPSVLPPLDVKWRREP